MICHKKINLPQIPSNLLRFPLHEDQPPTIVTDFNIQKFDYGFDHYLNGEYLDPPVYITKLVNHAPLTEWLSQFLKIPFTVGVSIVKQKNHGRMIVHQDLNKCCALNYVINTGGKDVVTNWFQESGQPVQRTPKLSGAQSSSGQIFYEKLTTIDRCLTEKNNWYLIRTDVLHDVENINGTRVLLQIKFNDFTDSQSFDKLLLHLDF